MRYPQTNPNGSCFDSISPDRRDPRLPLALGSPRQIRFDAGPHVPLIDGQLERPPLLEGLERRVPGGDR